MFLFHIVVARFAPNGVASFLITYVSLIKEQGGDKDREADGGEREDKKLDK